MLDGILFNSCKKNIARSNPALIVLDTLPLVVTIFSHCAAICFILVWIVSSCIPTCALVNPIAEEDNRRASRYSFKSNMASALFHCHLPPEIAFNKSSMDSLDPCALIIKSSNTSSTLRNDRSPFSPTL